jgi:hypothetical protein
VLEVILRRANLQTTGTIFNKETQLLAYVDDIDIVCRSQSAVRDAYLALEREAAKVGLKITEQKTKYMIAARNDRTIRDVGQSVAISASSDCANICSRATFHARQNSPFIILICPILTIQEIMYDF